MNCDPLDAMKDARLATSVVVLLILSDSRFRRLCEKATQACEIVPNPLPTFMRHMEVQKRTGAYNFD
jgi:hypothetical protein